MAITDSQKVDYLLKKIGYGVAKTDTSTVKSPANESTASPLLLRGDIIWGQSNSIPATAPAANTTVVATYTSASAVQTVNDGTASTNRTWKTNLTNWIGTEFGSTYQPKVWTGPAGAANIAATGTRLFPDGSGNNDSWFFDFQSGVLNFADTNVPTTVAGNVIYIEGYRYVGSVGIANISANTGTITFNNNTISSSSTNGNISIDPTGTGVVILDANTVINGTITVNSVVGNSTLSGNTIIAQTGSFSTSLVAQTITSNSAITAVTGNISTSLVVAANSTITSTQFTMNANTPSTSYTSGAVVVAGGVGIGGNLNVAGSITTSNLFVNGGDLTNVNLGNLTFSNTIVSTKLVNGNITLKPSGTGLVYIDSSLAMKLPTGNAAQQPANPPIGAFRYNTDYESPEFWNGMDWVSTTTAVDNEIINPTGSTNIYTLSRPASTNGIMVSLNGVLQLPGTAYVVSGTQITFTETPMVTDTVDIRYIASGSLVPIHEEQGFSIRTVGFNASVNTRYAVDTVAGPVTAVLPAVPGLGDAVYFADAGGAYASNNLIVNPNGQTIMGSPGNLVISTTGLSFGVFWNGTTWKRY